MRDCLGRGQRELTLPDAGAAGLDTVRATMYERLLAEKLYDTQRQLPERNYAKDHSLEEWWERNYAGIAPVAGAKPVSAEEVWRDSQKTLQRIIRTTSKELRKERQQRQG